MKLHHCLTALLLCASAVQAQDECRLDLSESRLDFGLMNRAVPPTSAAERLLGERQLSLTLNCPQPQDMSLFYRAMAAGIERLRFTDGGSYQLHVRDGVLDGRTVELGLLAGQGQAPSLVGANLSWRADHGVVPMIDGQPAMGRSFSVQLQVSAWAREEAVRVRDAVTWETSGLVDAPASGRSRELSLQARFAPAACTPSLSNNGTVNFGKLSVGDLNHDKDTALPERPLTLTVNCDGPAPFALVMHDNREGSATGGLDETAYGLGLDTRGQKIGRYYLLADPTQATADHLPQLYRTGSTTGGTAWSSASASPLPLGARSLLGFTGTAGGTDGPHALQTLSALLNLKAVIAPLNTLDLSNEVRLDGSATLEIIYF
ncbi:DUF1120 domain-containing protein [Pseudomonas canadensis]|uniref:DUF1120 domain-containing protein n=1 Tax=Pseudomonas canadensis TaxID=915099 RepID=A0ABZ1ADM7_9PSED|nr:DUF1120 domain-containing protein [Pseudomonas canadensis]WRI25840.1 DUF1120 domain-containing protein [Pseudomonas canadensis]